MSKVYLKFRSASASKEVLFEGASISVRDLKLAIAALVGLSRHEDILLENAQTGAALVDDAELVPRNTAVLGKRVPLHTTGAAPIVKAMPKHRQRAVGPPRAFAPSVNPEPAPVSPVVETPLNEEEKLQSVLRRQEEEWMVDSTPRRATTCFRCRAEGHFAKSCPLEPAPKRSRVFGVPMQRVERGADGVRLSLRLMSRRAMTVCDLRRYREAHCR